MKTKSIFAFLMVVAMVLTACGSNSKDSEKGTPLSRKSTGVRIVNGTDETQLFLGKYLGKFVDSEFSENLIIAPNGAIRRTEIRQVGGGNDSQVPYPTVCSYVKTGQIALVEKRDLSDRQRYIDFATHVIEVQYSDITLTNELEPSTISNSNCQIFITEMKNRVQHDGHIDYSYYAELLSDESFRIQTSGGGDYREGGPRTPSTLDEIYTKSK